MGLAAEDCAFLDFTAIRELHHGSGAVGARLRDSISENKRRHALTQTLILPPLITAPEEVYGFSSAAYPAQFHHAEMHYRLDRLHFRSAE